MTRIHTHSSLIFAAIVVSALVLIVALWIKREPALLPQVHSQADPSLPRPANVSGILEEGLSRVPLAVVETSKEDVQPSILQPEFEPVVLESSDRDHRKHRKSLNYFLDASHYLESTHHNPEQLHLTPADTEELNKLIEDLNERFAAGRLEKAQQTQVIAQRKLASGDFRQVLPGEGSSTPTGALRVHSVMQNGTQAEVFVFPEQEPVLTMLIDQQKLLIEDGMQTIQAFIELHGKGNKP